MKNIKKLESGFTLVELIVVVAMMSIVFGALMNVITPTNQFFDENEAFKDQIMISDGLTDALGDEVRYSTNVIVLENYVGVPYINADNKFDFPDLANVQLDSVLVLDNQNVRGSCLTGYNPNRTVASRKGARGQVLQFILNGSGVDFTECGFLYSEDYYGDYEYQFGAAGGIDENGLAYIDFDINMSDYTVEGGDYVYGDDPYDSSEYLYLKNINLKDNDGYKFYVYDFSSSVDDDDYANFPRASAPAGLSAIQNGYYTKDDADNARTWIFYYKGVTIAPTEMVTMTFDPNYPEASGFTGVPVEKEVKKGKPCNVDPPTFPEPEKESYMNGSKAIGLMFDGWVIETDDPDYIMKSDELKQYVATEDVTVKAHYSEFDPTYNVEFYDASGTLIKQYNDVPHGDPVTPPDSSLIHVPAGYDGFVWIYKGSGNNFVDDSQFASVTTDLTVEPYFYKRVHVTFFDESGGEVYKSDAIMSGMDFDTSLIPEVPAKSGYTGEWVIHNADGTNAVPNYAALLDDMNVYPSYTPIPVDRPALTISNAVAYGNNWGSRENTVTFNIKNTGTAPTNKFSITIPMKANVTSINNNIIYGSIVNEDVGGTYTIAMSGKNVTITFNGVVIKPGDEKTVSLQIFLDVDGNDTSFDGFGDEVIGTIIY